MRQLYTTVKVEGTPGGDSNSGFFLDYYVLSKEVTIEEQKVLRYGIEIYKRGRRPSGTPYIEYRKFFDVFGTEGEAMEMLSLLARNSVTPIAMKDILEDCLGVVDFSSEMLIEEAV